MVTKICSHCFYTKTQHSKLSLLWVRWNFYLQAVFLNLQVNRIVWTQLYSVVHSQSRIHCQLFSRTMAHSAPNLLVSLFLWRQCNKWGKVEGPWREPCQIKKPFKGQRRRRGRCWEEQKSISPTRGRWIAKANQNFVTIWPPNSIWLFASPLLSLVRF